MRDRGEKNPGNVLLSHQAALTVPSALEGLTSVFGMGTGVAPPLMSPGISMNIFRLRPEGYGGPAEAPEERRRGHWVLRFVRRSRALLSVNLMVKPHGRLVLVS